MTETLRQLSDEGVAIWLDDMSRDRLTTGNLAALIRDKHVVGVTTNPTIFQKAISDSELYDGQLRDLAVRGVDVEEARPHDHHERRPLGAATCCGRCTTRATASTAGSPSRSTRGSAQRRPSGPWPRPAQLWWLVDRPNLFIKIPATEAGLPAIAAVPGRGHQRQRHADLLARALPRRDGRLPRRHRAGPGRGPRPDPTSPRWRRSSSAGSTPRSTSGWTSSARRRPSSCAARPRSPTPGSPSRPTRRCIGTERWAALAAAGAKPQRPLWASTGVKDPAYDDTMYVVELVTRGIVNTMPEATLDAVRRPRRDPR